MSDNVGVDLTMLALVRMLRVDHAAEHAQTREMMRQLDARFQRLLTDLRSVVDDLKGELAAERQSGPAAFIGRLQTAMNNVMQQRVDPDSGLAIPQAPAQQ